MKRRKTEIRICSFCKVSFDAYVYNIIRGFGRYCSKKCSNKGNGLKFPLGHKDFRRTNLSIIGKKISNTKKGIKFLDEHKFALSIARIKKYDLIGRKECRGKKRQKKCYTCIKWRKDVFERDGYVCILCGIKGVYLEADHIRAWIKYPKQRHLISNGRTLCKPCHMKTPNYKSKARIWQNSK